MNEWEKEKFDLITDLDLAPLTVDLSFEDRYTLASSLLALGYRKQIKGNDKQSNQEQLK